MDVDLDATLGCGQAHRWICKNGKWEGVLNNQIITLTQTHNGFVCEGTDDANLILNYFRSDDDLNEIYDNISKHDEYVSELVKNCHGMRILNQPHWECIATYIIATNANVKRIGMMVDSVCREFGKDLGGRYSFPTAEEIVAKKENITNCRLGYREGRFIEFAEKVANNEFDPDSLESLSYEECITKLLKIKGVGPKVADCIALFSYGHLNAFPIDARIEKILDLKYNQKGSYKKLSEFAIKKFGPYAGYAQEFLYHSNFIE